jgi:hypothetical protein
VELIGQFLTEAEAKGLCTKLGINWSSLVADLISNPGPRELARLISPLVPYCAGFFHPDYDPADPAEEVLSLLVFDPVRSLVNYSVEEPMALMESEDSELGRLIQLGLTEDKPVETWLKELCAQRAPNEFEVQVGPAENNIFYIYRAWSRSDLIIKLVKTREDRIEEIKISGLSVDGFVSASKSWPIEDSGPLPKSNWQLAVELFDILSQHYSSGRVGKINPDPSNYFH